VEQQQNYKLQMTNDIWRDDRKIILTVRYKPECGEFPHMQVLERKGHLLKKLLLCIDDQKRTNIKWDHKNCKFANG
jgi:hypothetical protein